jgi:hypothetical protein
MGAEEYFTGDSRPFSAKVNNGDIYLHTSISLHKVVFNYLRTGTCLPFYHYNRLAMKLQNLELKETESLPNRNTPQPLLSSIYCIIKRRRTTGA